MVSKGKSSPSPRPERDEGLKVPKQAPQSKEDILRMMVDKDPEKAAELLRKMFLSGDKGDK